MEFLSYLFSTQADVSGARMFENALVNASATAKKAGHDISQSATLTNVRVKTSFNRNGQEVRKYTATIVDGNRRIQTSWRQTGKEIKHLNAGIKQTGTMAKKSAPMMGDFTKALRRVAIVVPVWLLFRSVLMSVIRTIGSGFKHFVELDAQLARSASVTTDSSVEMGKAMEMLGKQSEDFARRNAGVVKDVTDAYFRMATSGLDFTTSLQASIPATKLAVSTYGDVNEVAKLVSASYRLLGDTIEGATTPHEKILKIVNTLARAWQDSEFEMNQMAQAMANVAGQAKSFGLSFNEVIAVLATSHDLLIKGGRAGRLFGRSLDDMAQHLPAVEKLLGKTFDPRTVVDWFSVFTQLVGRFKELGKTTPQIEESLRAIFNIRASRQFRGIVATIEKFNLNLKILETDTDGAVDALLELRNATAKVQLENLAINLSIVVKEFVKGFTNAKDFATGLKDLNKWVEGLALDARVASAFIRQLGINLLTLATISKKLAEMQQRNIGRNFITGLFPPAMLANVKKDSDEFNKIIDDTIAKFGSDVFETPWSKGVKTAKEVGKEWGELRSELDLIKQDAREQLKIQQASLGLTQDENEAKDNGLGLTKQETAERKEQVKIAESLIKHELNVLKLRGASSTHIQKMEIALKNQFGLYSTAGDKLKDQLSLEQSITKEKLKQNKVSSDNITLWKIAKEHGDDLAKSLSEVVAGQKTFADLGKREQRVFTQEFARKAEQFQASEFFKTRGKEFATAPQIPDISQISQEIRRGFMGTTRQSIGRGFGGLTVPVTTKVNVNIEGRGLNREAIETEIQNWSNKHLKPEMERTVKKALKSSNIDKIIEDYNGTNIKGSQRIRGTRG